MAKNEGLSKAKTAKNDEFYTQLMLTKLRIFPAIILKKWVSLSLIWTGIILSNLKLLGQVGG